MQNYQQNNDDIEQTTGMGVIVDDDVIKLLPKRKGSPRRTMTIKEDNTKTESLVVDGNKYSDRTQNSRVIKIHEMENSINKNSRTNMSSYSPTNMKKKQSVVYDDANSDDRMFCFVRIRPSLNKEKYQKKSVFGLDLHRIAIDYRDSNLEYDFDKIFDENTTQKEVFQSFKLYAKKLFSGRSCTIMAYGQTGSGKTHTMFGMDTQTALQQSVGDPSQQQLAIKASPQRTQVTVNVDEDEDKMGLIPRTFHYIFDLIERTKVDAKVTISFFQIYREKIYDLLSREQGRYRNHLNIRESTTEGYLIENLSLYDCTCYEEALG